MVSPLKDSREEVVWIRVLRTLTTQKVSAGCGQTDCLSLVKHFVSLSGFRKSEIQTCEVTEGANARRTILANTHKRCNKQKVEGSKWLRIQEKRTDFVEKKTLITFQDTNFELEFEFYELLFACRKHGGLL